MTLWFDSPLIFITIESQEEKSVRDFRQLHVFQYRGNETPPQQKVGIFLSILLYFLFVYAEK